MFEDYASGPNLLSNCNASIYGYSHQAHVWDVIEYLARAKHMTIPHGWDTWFF